MKKVSFITAILSMAVFFSCNSNKKSALLSGEWKVTNMEAPMPATLPDSMKAQFDSIFKLQVEVLKKTSHFSYNDDGTYSYNFGSNGNKGTWFMNEEGTELTLADEGAQPETSKIIELSGQKMVLSSRQPDGNYFTLTLEKEK